MSFSITGSPSAEGSNPTHQHETITDSNLQRENRIKSKVPVKRQLSQYLLFPFRWDVDTSVGGQRIHLDVQVIHY